MNEGYNSKLTAHSVERSKQGKLFCECKIKVAYAGEYGKRGWVFRGKKVYES